MTDIQGAWPRSGQTLFAAPTGGRLSACLDSVRGKPYPYLEGYRRTAELLFERVASHGTSMDVLACPFIFVWRHAIELQLKTIVAQGKHLVSIEVDYPKHHGVVAAWKVAREVMRELQPDEGVEVEAVDGVLRELAALDPDSTGFRYYERKEGGATLLGAPDSLDLWNVHQVLSGIWSFFDAVLSEIAHRHELASDYLTET